MKPELFNDPMQSVQEADKIIKPRKYQDEMRDLSSAMPILSSQLATWACAMDALQEEVENQATLIVTQAQQLDYCDDEIDRLGKVNNELRKQLKKVEAECERYRVSHHVKLEALQHVKMNPKLRGNDFLHDLISNAIVPIEKQD